MTNFSRLTLASLLLGSLALPAVAQNGIVQNGNAPSTNVPGTNAPGTTIQKEALGTNVPATTPKHVQAMKVADTAGKPQLPKQNVHQAAATTEVPTAAGKPSTVTGQSAKDAKVKGEATVKDAAKDSAVKTPAPAVSPAPVTKTN